MMTTRVGSLKISSVRMFDAGTYLCRANNSDGQSPQTRVVAVDVLGWLHSYYLTPFTRSSKHRANVEQMYSKYTC